MTDESNTTLADTPTTSVGTRLREARERAGISLADVAQRIKISPQQIETLENNRFDELGWAFSRGFVRSYGRLLNLDPDALVSALPNANASASNGKLSIHHEHITLDKQRPWFRLSLIAIVLLLLFSAPWMAYHWLSATVGQTFHHDTSQPAVPPGTNTSTLTPELTPIVTSSATPTPAASPSFAAATSVPSGQSPQNPTQNTGPLPASNDLMPTPDMAAPSKPATQLTTNTNQHLELQFAGDSWVNIRDQQGHTLLARLYHAGETTRFDSTSPVSLIIGNAAQVRLTDNSKPVDLTPHTAVRVARLTLP